MQGVLANSWNNKVHKIYMPNIDLTTLPSMLALAQKYPNRCFPMIGLHPCYVQEAYQNQLHKMENWFPLHQFVAIGEIGIDLYHDTTYKAAQITAFTMQIDWAKKYNLPIVIHCRNAFKETIEILTHHQDGRLRGIFHCFTGDLSSAQQISDLGFYVGIGGIITMKNSGLDMVTEGIDLKDIVLETDSPYLAPHPHRGKRNEPSYLYYIAEKIAMIKNISLATVAKVTTANAQKVFVNSLLPT